MIESLFIALAICIDSFAVGLSYGFKNIKIPKKSLMVIHCISIGTLAVSMYFGNLVQEFLDAHVAAMISCFILAGLGTIYILQGCLQSFIEKRTMNKENKIAEIKFSEFKIMIDVMRDCTKADTDTSGIIDLKEALYIGIAVSLDSLGVGFGTGVGNINCLQVLLMAFIFNLCALTGGIFIGKKVNYYNQNLKTFWISGGILILLGLSKLT
ncbi:sporulation membrane protein YtaF [Inediibacterium massiliense]|uniref:sporulation membrane protein YtaF n=1 Tax=Inediibacterium massiliense TaxID=1658111 RepID=UPI0006B57284|nr:sporulation membrane protein YtaF [Inediibacterium massiliense]